MTDDPRENTWHPYPDYCNGVRLDTHTISVSREPDIYKRPGFTDTYQGLIAGEWVDVEQVRVIRQPTNPGAYSIRVSVVTIPEDDGL
jgi:hypothetical protein